MHSSESSHRGNSDVWRQLVQLGLVYDETERQEPVELPTEIHLGSVGNLLSAWLSDCEAVELGCVLVADQGTDG